MLNLWVAGRKARLLTALLTSNPLVAVHKLLKSMAFAVKMTFSAVARTDPSHMLYVPAQDVTVSIRITGQRHLPDSETPDSQGTHLY